MFRRYALLATSIMAFAPGLGAHQLAADENITHAVTGKIIEPGAECVNTQRSHPRLFSYGSNLLYRVSNDVVYVVRTSGGCEGVSRGDSLQTHPFKARLCVGDIAYTTQIPSNLPSGSCTVESVTPYKSKG